MPEDTSDRLRLAVEIAREAGRLTLEFFQRDILQVERKSDNSPVTQADRQAEQLLRQRIEGAFPRDAIVGEEYGECTGDSGYQWILDPIDGTKTFISGVPLYTVLIGVLQHGQSRIGVICAPGLDECVYAEKGSGCRWVKGNTAPQRALVSQTVRLADSKFVTSQVDSFQQRGAAEAYQRLERAAYVTRTWGDGYGYLLVATGRVDVMVDPVMNLWDAAAIQPVLEEAGGTFTDWQGHATVAAGEGIGTNGRVLEEVLAITRGYPRPR